LFGGFVGVNVSVLAGSSVGAAFVSGCSGVFVSVFIGVCVGGMSIDNCVDIFMGVGSICMLTLATCSHAVTRVRVAIENRKTAMTVVLCERTGSIMPPYVLAAKCFIYLLRVFTFDAPYLYRPSVTSL
jgi:hypothetical protein